MDMELHDLIGNAGLVLIALSFFFKNVVILRTLNLTGAALMVAYGAMIEEYQVWVLNTLIVMVNGYFIFLDKSPKSNFNVIEEPYRKGGLFDSFYDTHEEDIRKFFPDFNIESIHSYENSVILRDLTAAGIYVYRRKGEDAIIELDYVSPKFRDLANAIFLTTRKASEFKAQGVRRMLCKSTNNNHRKYLRQMGFVQDANDESLYIKNLGER